MSIGEIFFLPKTLMESETEIDGEGRSTFDAKETLPSLLPVSTLYHFPPLCHIFFNNTN